jgi:hypothetical protein
MNKLLPVIILALAASVAAVALADSMASAGADHPAVEPYKCYQARHAKRSPRFTPDRVFLTDQFRHNVEVTVLKLTTHCSEANQQIILENGTAAGDFDRGLDCYTIRDVPGQPQFHPANIPVSDSKFGSQVLTVSKAANLCVPGLKNFNGLRLQGGGFVCYQAKTANGQPRFQQRNIGVEDQYSSNKLVRVIRPVAYCSPVDKKLDAPNDDIADAPRIEKDLIKGGHPLDLHVSTVHATPALTDPIISCKTNYTNSVWYHWRYGGNKSLMLDTSGSSYDTVLAVFSGSPGSLVPVGCNDNGCPVIAGATAAGCDTTASFLQFDAWANTDYYILVGSSEGHGGKLKLRVSAKDVVGTADRCDSPISLSLLQEKGDSFLEHVSTMDATFDTGVAVASACDSGDPALSCAPGGYGYGSSAWFSYTSTVPGNDQLVNFDATTSSYSTVIAVFDTTVTIGRGEVACGANGFVAASLTAGHKYLIMVGALGQGAAGGKLKLNYELKRQLINPDGVDAGTTDLGASNNSLVCYQVRQARRPNVVDDITDQFSERQLDGAWTLSIGAVDSMCLPSLKPPCSTHAYANNFQSVVGSEWSNTSTDTTPVGNRRFLGQFGNDTVSLNLNGLPAHDQVTVCFDLFVLKSWDGNDTGYGPDVWDLSVNGGPTLLHTTFSNTEEDGHQQNYPDSFPGGKHPADTDAAEVDTLGYSSSSGDSVYHLIFTFSHTANSIELNFSGSGLQGIGDESWGLDNVIVQTR